MGTQYDGDPGDEPVLRLRITHITTTMSLPLPSLAMKYAPPQFATAVPPGVLPHHMPVIRIFGTTPGLQKICANIHLCYPYFFVPFPMDSNDPLRPERVVRLCQRFAVSLNHAICLAMRQNPTGGKSNKYAGGTDPKHLHVVSVMLVKGVPFYGYHLGYSYYLKVSLVNPQRMYVALEQLRKPVVLGREWQPHEAHMSHVLQFMCDFDLYGCGWLDLSGGTFRNPLPEGDPLDSPPRDKTAIYNTLTVPGNMLYTAGLSPPRDTYTPLEIDVLPNHIMNRRRLKPRALHQDFVELLRQPLNPDEKLVPAVAELWEDERRRRAQRSLSLSETAMMPAGGGMGGRNMEELGYKVEGKAYGQNTGGDWKISPELWAMLEERMGLERARKGRLTFERFAADAQAGKDGEKRKYDRWIMTTFEALSAHWPKDHVPGSTARSRRSRPSKASSVLAPSSPLARRGLGSSPRDLPKSSSPVEGDIDLFEIKAEPVEQDPAITNGQAFRSDEDDLESTSDDDDEDNPFDAYAMSSQTMQIKVEVNPHMIARPADAADEDDEEEEASRVLHAADARQHAEEAVRLRATQVPTNGDDSGDDNQFDDEELDQIFRDTVFGGYSSRPSTPQRGPRVRGSATPTTRGSAASVSGGSGGYEARRIQRERVMRERAGFGDLSTIIDRSSASLTPTPRPQNPFDDRLRTPGKGQQQFTPRSSEKVTPTSMVKNLFAKNRKASASPMDTPSKRPAWPPANTVILPPTKRSVVGWGTPSPDDPTDESPSKAKPEPVKDEMAMEDVKPAITEELTVRSSNGVEILLPAGQKTPSNDKTETTSGTNDSSHERLKPVPSPTYIDPPGSETTALRRAVHHHTDSMLDPDVAPLLLSQDRPRKRVRMAEPFDEPQNPFSLQSPSAHSSPIHRPSQASQRSQASQLSQLSVPSRTSLISSQSAPTSETTSVTAPAVSDKAWTYRLNPPSTQHVMDSMESAGQDTVIYQEPYYSNQADVPFRPKMFAGRMFSLKGDSVAELPEFEETFPPSTSIKRLIRGSRRSGPLRSVYGWEFAKPPPACKDVIKACAAESAKEAEKVRKQQAATSQLAKPTQKDKYGFKFTQNKKNKDAEREHQNMSVLAIEVFAKSRHQLLPDPEKDEMTAVFFCYLNEDDSLPDTTIHPNYYAGYVVIDSPQTKAHRARLEGGIPCHVVDSELDLINWVIDIVKAWDPDVLAGWELHNASWGYLASRADQAFSVDLTEEISRVVGGHSGPKKDFYSATHTSTFKVSGRHILNVWRICRSEINLNQYSFENVVFHLLHQRVPRYSAASLTALWKSKIPEHTNRVLKYFFQRVVIYMEVIDAAEIITKNAQVVFEFARVFGVDFASVMFRGSQFKVESFMFRIAKPENFVLVSPSKQQVGLQNAPFATPLIAEPESKYYNHPIIVLDFQSLYPSVMIAYNICYSTCLGRVEKFKGTDKFGFTELRLPDGLLELLKDYLTVTPNGMVFVKPAVRKSLLAKMLGEILDTRVMVKQAMKGYRNDKSLTQLLNARQLGLKLMANVTYGYTSATYSGRMPCIEVADSIVQTGRETLEKAQELIHSRADWNAQVVYGDTDSLFVALPGRSREQAFKIGNDIADTVTAMNPKPVRLKFEKVYMGSVLMAKKRYVGFKYEHPDDTEPVFDAKGIETIRRDGFPAQQKIEEVCLKMLFRHQDLSQIKEFCRQEWTKILTGRVSIQDFIIAKEVRLGSYSDKGVPPPGAAVAYRRILKDPRDEPQYAERVPYIISNSEGRRLIDRARMPEEMLANRSLGIDGEYYIRNLLIPPLSRIFNLVGADIENWYESMPRTKRVGKYDVRDTGKMRIDSHFRSSHCLVCGNESSSNVCRECRGSPSTTAHALLSRTHLAEAKMSNLHRICASCSSTPAADRVLCDSIDCPVLYAKVQAQRDVEDLGQVRTVLAAVLLEDDEAKDDGEFAHAFDW